jgi:hypothetical protein
MTRRIISPDQRRPLTEDEKKLLEQMEAGTLLPPFLAKPSRRSKSKIDIALTGLQQARAEAAKQAGWVQDLIFDNWIKNRVEEVDDPREWTQAHTLYENYLEHARAFGKKWKEKQAAFQALATETQWGRWMATRYTKSRRTRAVYYPLRCKRG